jgi:hypothetical protein
MNASIFWGAPNRAWPAFMDEQAKVDQIVENLYAGTLDAGAWKGAINGIADWLSCSCGILFTASPTTQVLFRDEVFSIRCLARSGDYASDIEFERTSLPTERLGRG